MKDFFIDATVKAGLQFALYFYILITALCNWLDKFNMHLDFLYLGLIGTILANAISIYMTIKNSKSERVLISRKSVLLTVLELVIGPVSTMVFMSFLFDGEISKTTTLLAVGFGAFWEVAWSLFRGKFKEYFKGASFSNNQNIQSIEGDNDGESNPPTPPKLL